MASKTLTISVPQADFDYLQEDGLLSPSKIFQVALKNIKESRSDVTKEVKKLRGVNRMIQDRLLIATEILRKHGLIEEYDKNVVQQG